MEKPKKIVVDYSGSWVNTTKIFGFLFLIAGLISSAVVFFSEEGYNRDEVVLPTIIIIFVSMIVFTLWMSLSKILQHFLYIRKYLENEVSIHGYEFNEDKKLSKDFKQKFHRFFSEPYKPK